MRKNFVVRWLVLLTVLSCNPDKHKIIDLTQPHFKTIPSTTLFFRNVRAPYYDKVEMYEAKMNQFRLKERNQSDTLPIINVCILEAWMRDEAYIYIEPNTFFEKEDTIWVYWRDIATDSSGTYHFSDGDRERHYVFATQLYTSIQQKHQLSVKIKNQIVPFLDDENQREVIRKTLLDYYRLVGAVR
ncbi:MAG: hypothetical protein NZ521_01295 [Flammeovirgaceae bacterium]|nr:hypothetical protein [Flammeovirgaceae bacterium]MDW8286713.1 hypothetical protein [Flammeovirgaceae bacterium]